MCVQSVVKGTVDRETRLLGPILPFDGVLRTEWRNIIKAARAEWRPLGHTWYLPLPHRLKRMLFLCFVYSAAISGLSAFVLPEDCTDRLDSVIVRMLRGLVKGRPAVTADDGRSRRMPSRT
eukprot:3929679-Pyramimonas_sp.AAC.1